MISSKRMARRREKRRAESGTDARSKGRSKVHFDCALQEGRKSLEEGLKRKTNFHSSFLPLPNATNHNRLSNKSNFYDFTPVRSTSGRGDFHFSRLVRQPIVIKVPL